jgi:cytochrome c-type biogenesis protein CcmE
MMNRRKMTKTVIAIVIIGSATAYLLYVAVVSSLAYCYLVDEFVESSFYKMPQNDAAAGDSKANVNRIIRLAGWVKQDSIVTNAEKMQLDFELAGEKNTIPVRFYGAVPKNFEAGKEVFVEGRIGNDRVFNADRILTRCESKYKAKLQTKLSESKGKPSIGE